MEEIITVDGNQFKLTTDRPLTALEKQQTIAQIKQQTGCGSCHQPKALSRGGVYSLPFDGDVTGTGAGPKSSGDTVTLSAQPLGGVGPYDVRFWRSNTGVAPIQTGIATPGYLASGEGITVSTTYVLTDIDVAAAVGNTTAAEPSAVNLTTGAITLGGAVATLSVGSIRFYTSIVDSCPNADKGTCAQYADVTLACVAPTCNFVVT